MFLKKRHRLLVRPWARCDNVEPFGAPRELTGAIFRAHVRTRILLFRAIEGGRSILRSIDLLVTSCNEHRAGDLEQVYPRDELCLISVA